MTDVEKKPCRKCGELNPVSNDYCRHCGAVLEISTIAVKAQRGPVLPAVRKIRFRYVFLTAAAMLGLMTVLFSIFAAVSWLVFDAAIEQRIENLGSVKGGFVGVTITIGSLFLLAFGLGGFGISWLAKRRSAVEPMISSVLVLALFTAIGLTISEDAPIITAVLFLPSVASAGLGSKLGMVLGGSKGK